MYHHLLLLVISISSVISISVEDTINPPVLLEREVDPFCVRGQTSVCCSGPASPSRYFSGEFIVSGCTKATTVPDCDQGRTIWCCQARHLIKTGIGRRCAPRVKVQLPSHIPVSAPAAAQDSTSNLVPAQDPTSNPAPVPGSTGNQNKGAGGDVPDVGQDSAGNQDPNSSPGWSDMSGWIPAAGAATGGLLQWGNDNFNGAAAGN